MKLGLVVIGDGRWEYLQACMKAIAPNVLHPITARVMVDDSGDDVYGQRLNESFPEWHIVHGGRRGMAGAVQAGFDAILSHDPDYVLWLEEDMQLLRPLPISEASYALDRHRRVAQMCFRREPWWGSPEEMAAGDQLQAIVNQAAFWDVGDDYTTHDFIFSLNPCLIPADILRMGWVAGGIGVGNETGFTRKCLDQGYVFASWGRPGKDVEPWVRHIGEQRGAGWSL